MTLQNIRGENKIFIDESVNGNNLQFIKEVPEETDTLEILLDTHDIPLFFEEEKIEIYNLDRILYQSNHDFIMFISKSGDTLCMKWLKDNEIVSLSKSGDENRLIFSTMELPKFLSQDNYDEKYPKFEVNLSDCTYSMKIYMNDSEYIEIPDFQSHITIHSTLDYISQLAFYLTEGRPGFFEKLCNEHKMEITIYNEEHVSIGYQECEYILGEEGIFLTGGELKDYLVEWQKFFKLVMDGKWEVDFE